MVTVSFTYQAGRARKARTAQKLGRSFRVVAGGVAALLTAAAAYLLSRHLAIGFSILGADVLLIVLVIWYRGDIAAGAPVANALNTDSIQLQNCLESKLLSRLGPTMTAADVWLAATKQWEGVFVIQRLGVPYEVITDLLRKQAGDATVLWSASVELARSHGAVTVDSGVVVAAALTAIPALAEVLRHLKLQPADVISVLEWEQRMAVAMHQMKQPVYFGGIGRDWASGYTPLLDRSARNLSDEVQAGRYRHVPSVHESLIDQMIQLLAENRPIALVGGVGSGKTELVYGLAERMLAAKEVGPLAYYQVMELNASILLSSGTSIEELMLQVLTEAVSARNTILLLDEAQLFFSNGPGAIDLTQILLPILQRKALKIVLAMTEHDWQTLTAHQPAFAGSLQRLIVTEPVPAEVLKVVQDAAIGIEHPAHAVALQESVTEAIRLAGRYLPEVSFPGKAITVLEGATHYASSGFITAASVQQAIEATTGAKVTAVSQPERQQLLDLETQIHQRMINQTRAVKVVSDALRRARAGVSSPKRPVGSFLFLGPTGVGKTELAKALAAIYYGGTDAIVRIDMSEYQQQSDLSRLLAPSSGKQAGVTLASGVRQRPSSVVLLDEVEKAHPDILNLLLQVLDEGRLTDSDGRVVSFTDTIVIATSNAAADEIRQRISAGEQLEAFEAEITEHLIDSHQFRPELLNRFDEIVVFRPLTQEELTGVVGLMLKEVNATLLAQNITVTLTPAAVTWLAQYGYDPKLGARPLRRLVQRSVENVVAERILAGSLEAGQTVTLDATDLQPGNAPAT